MEGVIIETNIEIDLASLPCCVRRRRRQEARMLVLSMAGFLLAQVI